MRIISGFFKGKKILTPKDEHTRPLKDLTKESIFNIINHSNKLRINLNKATILDLFSGVGSFGLECLSRGAKEVTFIENYEGVLPILEKNLASLKAINNFKILKKDIYNESVFINLNNRFDIIFLDPPYKDKNINKIFYNIEKSGVLNNDGVIILHRHKNENEIFSEKFKKIEEKIYGLSKIMFFNYLN